MTGGEIQDDVLDEGCYYLSKLGLTDKDISQRFEISVSEVAERRGRFMGKVKEGVRVESSSDLNFWKDVRQEAEGNVKVTFVSDRGFHHSWRSEMEKLDGATLLSIYESCKKFLNTDANARFLEYDPPKNYDPLAMQREISKAVGVIGGILEEKWKRENEKDGVHR